jgi:hypothetical protein
VGLRPSKRFPRPTAAPWAFQIRSPTGESEPNLELIALEITMNWYHYIACFFAGLFLANAVPHFVKGVCGDRFPTPFAKPPGKGLSSPLVNVLWALLNMIIGYVLLRVGRASSGGDPALATVFIGGTAISVMASVNFAHKHSA